MQKPVDLIRSFILIGVSEVDLGFICKWILIDPQMHLIDAIAKIEEFQKQRFFDQPNKVQKVIDHYQEYIDHCVDQIETT